MCDYDYNDLNYTQQPLPWHGHVMPMRQTNDTNVIKFIQAVLQKRTIIWKRTITPLWVLLQICLCFYYHLYHNFVSTGRIEYFAIFPVLSDFLEHSVQNKTKRFNVNILLIHLFWYLKHWRWSLYTSCPQLQVLPKVWTFLGLEYEPWEFNKDFFAVNF